MAAISKAWVTIADGAVDPDSPVDATLMTGLRDDGIHLREWMGASFFAGAVQDHNHDGSNSALIQIGSNALRNGSFEDGLTGWAFTDFGGGSHAISTSSHRHGAKALEITSTVLANGGGNAVSGEFIPISELEAYPLHGWVWASVANVSSKIEAIWYDNAQALISTSVLLSYTNTPTTATHHRLAAVAPTNARFCKIKVTGGVPAVGTATGTVRFDGLVLTAAAGGMVKLASGSITSAVATLDIVMTAYTAYKNKLLVLSSFAPVTDAVRLLGRVSTDGGSTYDAGAGNYRYAKKQHTSTPASGDTGGTDTAIEIMENVGNASEVCNAKITMYDTPNTSFLPTFSCEAVSTGSAPNTILQMTAVQRLVAQDTDAFRVLFSSGNIASGTWELYGYN